MMATDYSIYFRQVSSKKIKATRQATHSLLRTCFDSHHIVAATLHCTLNASSFSSLLCLLALAGWPTPHAKYMLATA
jgi:hypothetical protein